MTELTPNMSTVKSAYVFAESEVSGRGEEHLAKMEAEFDRWLDEDRRTIAAATWDEGYQEANQDLWRDGGREGNPYRAAALGLTAEQEGEAA